LKSIKIPLGPPFSKGEEMESYTADSPKALLPLEREDGRDFLKSIFKKMNLSYFVILALASG
jgi:hypothetical protein